MCSTAYDFCKNKKVGVTYFRVTDKSVPAETRLWMWFKEHAQACGACRRVLQIYMEGK